MIDAALVQSILKERPRWPDGCVAPLGRVNCKGCGVAKARWCNHEIGEHQALCEKCLAEYAAFFHLDQMVNGPI